MAATISAPAHHEVRNPSQLPTFVFPAKASPSSSPASLRRPMSIPAELPSFSFGPAMTTTSTLSPPISPCFANFDLSNSPRAAGHRRGTSEFIGGDGKVGSSAGLMSKSPTQGALPPPNPGRRGHAHRRSAAVSAHDIMMILSPATPNTSSIPRGGSAPSSPSSHGRQRDVFDLAKFARNDDASPTRATNRVRVGFSDNVEVIPRPVSVISSDTSSTVTMRPSRSLSNSPISMVSGEHLTPPGTLSPPSPELLSLPSPNIRGADSRPRTASAILDPIKDTAPPADCAPSSARRGSMPLLDDIQALAPPSPRKKWTFFGLEPASGTSSPNRSRPVSSTSMDKEREANAVNSSPPNLKFDMMDIHHMPCIEPSCSRRSSISRKSGKKQKKVKSWAGSILSRKSRSRGQKKKKGGRRSATPPVRPYTAMSDSAALDIEPLPIHAEAPPAAPEPQDFASWKPRQTSPSDDDAMSPIIDLDAALGPFNTPSSYGAEWESSQKTSSKRKMHSAAVMGGFIGPGMHYHRRAESAPEMVPFENRFGIHRLGSSSTMADVFEEDEEDDEWEDTKASSDKDSLNRTEDDEPNVLGIDIKAVEEEAASNSDKNMDRKIDETPGIKHKDSALGGDDYQDMSASLKSDHSSTSLKDEPLVEEESVGPIEIADDSIPPRPASGAQSSEAAATPPFRPRPTKDLALAEINPFALQPAYLASNSPHSTVYSSFPSPRSPFSYDTQRISTAPSSIGDENAFQSLLLGEPGPELRMSVDDVPSLTSSNSTMTRESGANPGCIFRDGQRSVSVSSSSGPNRKRSSIASLTRLIGSSHGERQSQRSKLSIESRAPMSDPDMERKDKGMKGSKRISRMIQFFKPKQTKDST
ncbi:hypothetical protein DSL72_001685 [Monilinia vaccinii-corymbosi]|uniref:Cell wall proline rich protein n=1 Tax=Monilinia vaccinii-corymbosi TaxID=61207 RepID=A0A8A3P7R5_9HELO|nr:hypothetical protein DSL72_001685 [Monilinia vaccinii-corymbosi]